MLTGWEAWALMMQGLLPSGHLRSRGAPLVLLKQLHVGRTRGGQVPKGVAEGMDGCSFLLRVCDDIFTGALQQ